MMDCEQVRQWLERDLDGAAEPSGDVAAHLDRCRACAAEAGRTKAIAESARAALPPADVPVEFTERVLDEILEPAGDQRLVAAARPRLRRWLPLVAVAALLPIAFLLRGSPTVSGDLRIERDGEWIAAKTAEPGETFGLEPGGAVEKGEIRITAQELTLLQEEEGTVLMLAGDVVVETTGTGVTGTPLGQIRMQADSVCLATLECEGEVQMKFVELKKAVPAVLAVTVLAGGATIVNGQGAQLAGPGERVIVEGSNPPRLDPVAVQREFDRMRVELEDARRQLALLRGGKPRVPDVKRQIEELDRAANANKDAINQLAQELAALRMVEESPETRARIAEVEAMYRSRVEVAKVHDEKRQALVKRAAAEEIVKESRDLARMAEELREEIEEDEVSDAPFQADEAAARAQRLRVEIARLEKALTAARKRYEDTHPQVREMTVMLEHRREALRRFQASLPTEKEVENRIEILEGVRIFGKDRVFVVDKDGNVVQVPGEQDWDSTRRLDETDPEKAALKAEIERLKKELRKERWVWRRDPWDLTEFLASRYAAQRRQIADLEAQLKENPDDADLRVKHAALLKEISGLERYQAEARKDASRRERKELKESVKRLKAEISELKRHATDERTAARVKQLEEALDVAERELAKGDLQGRVIAAKEGIVVLSVGSDDGVTPGFAFNVNRGNQWIARVVVTEVKERQCVARLDLKRAESELTPEKGDLIRRAD